MAAAAYSSRTAKRSLLLGLLLSVLGGRLHAQELIFNDGFESGNSSAWEPCEVDGTYNLTAPTEISYYCCFAAVDFTIDRFIFAMDGSQIATAPSNPETMFGAGASCPTGSFTATRQIAGGCTINYSVAGTFSSATTWQGTYQLDFTGPDCGCFGLDDPCVDQTFPIETSR